MISQVKPFLLLNGLLDTQHIQSPTTAQVTSKGQFMQFGNRLGRREFFYLSAFAAVGTVSPGWINLAFASEIDTGKLLGAGLPSRPSEKPLNWKDRADSFDRYVMDPQNHVFQTRHDGTSYFASALEGTGDGGLTTFAPLVLGKILRADPVDTLIPSMATYFNEEAGIFLDGTHAELCEYWYLMNVNALAFGVVRLQLAHDSIWTGRVRSSADRLIDLAHQVAYNFNDQGYRFNKRVTFTNKDIYRQPDSIGGYAYVMLFAYEIFGDTKYLEEAKKGLHLYQSFASNPWYEIPSGAMAVLAAARLSVHEPAVDMLKIVSFALEPNGHPLNTGTWGNKEVNGLMAGFSTEPVGEAYSMESLIVLPYILPALRYRPEFATIVGRYVLNTAANMRLFYSDCIPRENQSRPDLTSAVPYERLTKELEGHSPYASGDYESHRSIYGGAYALWWGELVKPTEDEYILQLDVSKSDFLAAKTFRSYLYYNSYEAQKAVTLKLGESTFDVYDLVEQRFTHEKVTGSFGVEIPGNGSRVLVVVPSSARRELKKGVLYGDGIPIDYRRGK
jgi:hypothetical protein